MELLALIAQQPFRKAGFGEMAHHGVTTLHPIGLLAVIVLGLLTLTVKRKYAAWPMIAMAFFVSPAQRVVIATLDFNMLRLLVLAGWLRLLMRGEYTRLEWRKLDTLILAWGLVSMAAYVLLRGTVGAFVFRAGQLYDIFGMYLYFRVTLRSWADLDRAVRFAMWLVIPAFVFFLVEKSTGRNPYSYMGGVPAQTIAREGRLRAQGPFPHAILAGCFFACWLPLIAVRFWRPGGRMLAIVTSGLVLAIVVMCSSSTPVVAVMAAAVGALMWPLRRSMAGVRWGVFGTLFALHLVMKAPVWHLISRISFSRGSTSYHRFLLIDNSIRHFQEWWLLGSLDTGHWGHAMYDLTNQYVREGVKGGFLALVLFTWVLVHAYSLVGKSWRYERRNKYKRRLAWSLGVCLFVHTAMFLSISITHSQQNMLVFFLLFASIGSLSPSPARVKAERRARARARRAEQPRLSVLEPAGSGG